MSLDGVFAASLTPMHADFSCNVEALADHCKDMILRGCTGVAIFGTTGEGSSFATEEKKSALEAILERGVDPQKIILGTGCCSIVDVVELTKIAVRNHCLATLIMPPFFYKTVGDEGVIAFYREIIHRTGNPDLRILLYHIPQYSGVPITLNVIQTLHREFPEVIVGIKDSEGNLAFAKEILTQFPQLKLFVGRELQLSELTRLGAAGAISGLANAYPDLICSLYNYGKDDRKPNRQQELESISKILKQYPIFPAIKSLVEHQKGPQWHTMRPPLIPLDVNESQLLKTQIKE